MSDKKLGDYTLKEVSTECALRIRDGILKGGSEPCQLRGEHVCPFANTFVCQKLEPQPYRWLSEILEDEVRKERSD